MNYERIYSEFIADRLTKQPVKPTYFEKHHIVPRSLGGGNEKSNIIRLVPEDHLFAHLMLAKVHGGGMWHAVNAMLMQSHKRAVGSRYSQMRRRLYAKAKIEFSAAHSAKMKGRVFSADHRLKISIANAGVKDSAETRRRKSEGHKGLVKSEESRAKQSAALTGKKKSADHVSNMRAALTGRKLSAEHVEKIRQEYLSREVRFGFGGNSHSENTRARMSAVNSAKKVYAAMFGVSPKYVNLQMILGAGIEIGNTQTC